VQLVLASESPRRLALLGQAGITPTAVVATAIDEAVGKHELPAPHALRLALEKLQAAGTRWQGEPAAFLAADTVVALGRRILPKAADAAEVRACLEGLSGRSHRVVTAVAVRAADGKVRTRMTTTKVTFIRLTEADIAHYAACGEGIGKAGGYAVQGRAETFVRRLSGSYSNVVGLPLRETVALLRASGYPC
jgi:septum formation protein